MNLTALEDQLIAHEGMRYEPYDDATSRPLRSGATLQGKLTIGVGRNLSDRGLTRSEVNVLLGNDIAIATSGAGRYRWFAGLNKPRQAVCVSMVFSCGAKGWGLFKLTHAAIAEGRWEDAAVELLDSRFAEQVGDRALHLAEMLRTGRWLDA